MSDSKPEFEIVITRFGNVCVYRRHPDGHVTFWSYMRSIEGAIHDFRHWPVTIVVQGPNTPPYVD
jgi:hypothetical protein